VRDIRRRRARRWGLETERGNGLRHRHAAKAAGNSLLPGPTTTTPILDSTRSTCRPPQAFPLAVKTWYNPPDTSACAVPADMPPFCALW
jgi:hypothetical protein